MSKLKACPNPECCSYGKVGVAELVLGGFAVFCDNCDTSGPVKLTKTEAIAAWNNLPREEDCE